jgi:transposase
MSTDDSLPDDVATLKAMLLAERAARTAAEAASQALALMIEKLKFAIAKLRHERFGQSSERAALIEQLELQLADLEENAAEAEAAVEVASPPASSDTLQFQGFERRKPARRPLPDHLLRERIVYPAPSACLCCGGTLRKIGEDVTETLEVVPRQWKVIQHVRAKFSCVPARRLPSLPLPRIRLRAGAPGQGCSPMCCSPNMACICRSTARARPMPARASVSMSPRSPTGWAPQPQP